MPTKPKKNTPGAPETDNASYLDFLSKLRLVGLGLTSSSTSLDRKLFWQVAEDENGATRSFKEAYRATGIAKDSFEVEGQYEIIVGTEDRAALRVECTFEVHMHSTAAIDRAMVERFARSDVRFVLLPYARLFVTDVTAQMQIPPVVLPLATAAGKARAHD